MGDSEQMQEQLDKIGDFVKQGFDAVNEPMGLLIALVAALLLKTWKKMGVIVVGAVIFHLILQQVAPVMVDRDELRFPDMFGPEWWYSATTLFAGYFILISVLYFIRTKILQA